MYRCVNVALLMTALALPVAHAADAVGPLSATESMTAALSATDAGAPVPETKLDSAFTGYQPFREQKLLPWREINDTAHEAGGHMGIFSGSTGSRHTPPPLSAKPIRK
jgi:hypothetical protein